MAVSLPANAGDFPSAFVKSAREYFAVEYLPKIERCLEQLSDEQIWWRGNEQSNSIGNLILHLSGNARQWIICGLGGEPDNRRRDQEFAQRGEISKADLLKFLKETLTRVDEVLAQLDT